MFDWWFIAQRIAIIITTRNCDLRYFDLCLAIDIAGKFSRVFNVEIPLIRYHFWQAAQTRLTTAACHLFVCGLNFPYHSSAMTSQTLSLRFYVSNMIIWARLSWMILLSSHQLNLYSWCFNMFWAVVTLVLLSVSHYYWPWLRGQTGHTNHNRTHAEAWILFNRKNCWPYELNISVSHADCSDSHQWIVKTEIFRFMVFL